jgi:hypothetical protein
MGTINNGIPYLTMEMRHKLNDEGVSIVRKYKDYWVATQVCKKYDNSLYYTFGRVYHCGTFAFYDQCGCATFNSLLDCMEAVCRFFGIRYNVDLKTLYG